MRHLILLSTLLILAFVAAAPAGGTEQGSSPRIRTPWHFVPKGVHMEFSNNGATANAFVVAVPRDRQPWYIGPKGGDAHKGVRSLSFPGAATGADAVTTAGGRPWYIGPKGGDTRKGAR